MQVGRIKWNKIESNNVTLFKAEHPWHSLPCLTRYTLFYLMIMMIAMKGGGEVMCCHSQEECLCFPGRRTHGLSYQGLEKGQELSNTGQGSDEPYQDFVSCPLQAVSCLTADGEAEVLMLMPDCHLPLSKERRS